MLECTRRIQFCAGHRVYRHESKCAHPHGHNYVALIHARTKEGPELDAIGRVVDFSVLKLRIGGWIEKQWDHGFLYFVDDSQCAAMLNMGDQWKTFAMPYNPTAENMAKYLVEEVCPTLMQDTGVEIFKVTLHETENCYAVYEKDG